MDNWKNNVHMGDWFGWCVLVCVLVCVCLFCFVLGGFVLVFKTLLLKSDRVGI